jgi:hypothetical protein
VISGELIALSPWGLQACSIACGALAGNAKAQEKPLEGEILSLTWYTHQYANVGIVKMSSWKWKEN